MKIRVVRAFRGYKRGQEFDWDSGFAKILVARGFVEVVEPAVETASVEPRTQRAAVTEKARRRQT